MGAVEAVRSGSCFCSASAFSQSCMYAPSLPANVSVSAARTGMCWCEQGCHLSSLDQKSTRTSAGTIRQAGQADVPFPPGRIGVRIEFGKPLRRVQKKSPDRPASCKEQKSPEPGQFCQFCQSQALGHLPREPILPTRLLSPVTCTLDSGRQSPHSLSS